MKKNDLILKINSIKNAKRIYRDEVANFILNHPDYFSLLVELVFESQNKTAIKSSWILELVCEKNILLLCNQINYFLENLNKITNESALRPISKVSFFIIQAYSNNQLDLNNKQKEILIQFNFDWLINNHKVACQAYAMDNLYLLGKEFNWVHHELELILQKNLISKSAGYQVRAKRNLEKLK